MADAITFARSEEQGMLASTLREMLASTTDMDRTRELSLSLDALDTRAWQSLCDMGVVGLALPSSYGGADSPYTDMAVVFEEVGRVVAAVPLLSCVVASAAILGAATDDQASTLLPEIASGATVATLAVFEDAHAQSIGSPRTTARRTAEGWHISGRKRFVTDAPLAAKLVVSAAVDDDLALFVIDAASDGVTITSTPALDATRPLGDVTLDLVVDDAARLGGSDVGGSLSHAIDVGVVMVASEQVGLAQRCLEMSVEYAKTRFQFGRAIGSFQAIKHRCADMLVAVEHARSVAWHAASSLDDPAESPIAVPLAKSVCSEAAMRASGDTIQILGGIGFTWEHDAHLYFKRAKSTALLFGSVATFRDRLADAIGV